MRKNKLPPIFLPVISLISGISWQKLYYCNVYLILLMILFLLSLLFFFYRKIENLRHIQILTLPIVFFGGAFLFQCQKDCHLLLMSQLQNKKIDVIAQVEDKNNTNDGKIKEALRLKIKQIKYNEQKQYQQTAFDIICYLQKTTTIMVKDIIELKNIPLTIPLPKQNISNNPTFKDYLTKENIAASLFTKKLTYKKLTSPKYSLKRWIWKKKKELSEKLKIKLFATSLTYFYPIFLGNKKENSFNNLKAKFSYWGICHYLARSGLHIILFILIWKFILSLLPIHLYLKKILLILLCLIYLMFSWTSISFLRALSIFFLYEIGKIFNQSPRFLHLLSLICLIILLLNPIQMFFLDFQLSFALTFCLGWLSQVCSAT